MTTVPIEVIDRGPGVPAHHREAIFRQFWRGAAPGNGGAGLGLPIVKRIAEAHGGSVHVDDRKGGGAVFRIKLPVPGLAGLQDEAGGAVRQLASLIA